MRKVADRTFFLRQDVSFGPVSPIADSLVEEKGRVHSAALAVGYMSQSMVPGLTNLLEASFKSMKSTV